MNDMLPIAVKKDNIFRKISNLIKQIFYQGRNKKSKTKGTMPKKRNRDFYKVEGSKEKNDELIKEIKQNKTLQDIIKIIERNPEAMKKLDTPKLEIIDNYYQEQIKKYKEKIERIS